MVSSHALLPFVTHSQISTQAAASELQAKILGLEKQIEEGKAKDAQLRQTNKVSHRPRFLDISALVTCRSVFAGRVAESSIVCCSTGKAEEPWRRLLDHADKRK